MWWAASGPRHIITALDSRDPGPNHPVANSVAGPDHHVANPVAGPDHHVVNPVTGGHVEPKPEPNIGSCNVHQSATI